MSRLAVLAAICGISLLEHAAVAATETFTVIFGGENVGHLVADTEGSRTRIDFDYKNNGRGPTIAETIVTDSQPSWSGKSPADDLRKGRRAA
jgi:hypothetical protein